jgi:hypothetical protein
MPQEYISSPAMMLNVHRDDAASFARRAVTEREHAISAPNEVVASVHEIMAGRYAAMATLRHRSKNSE